MRLAALVLLVLPLSLRASPLDPQLSAQFATLRDGVLPKLVSAELSTEKTKLIQKTEAFAKLFDANRTLGTRDCARYNALVRTMTSDVARTLRAFEGVTYDVNQPAAIDARVRLQFELPSFEKLASFFAEEREGGYGLIDRHQKFSCPYVNREALNAGFQDLAQDYGRFLRDALGSPGVLDLERTTERLLTLALREETRAGRSSAAVNGGLLVASLVTWQFGGPILAAGFTKAFGEVGARLAGNWWFKKGAFWSAMVVEWKLQNMFADYMNPETAQRHEYEPGRLQIRFPSWEEHIGDMEKLATSGLHEPQLYLGYMSSLSAQLARVVQNWAHANEAALKAAAAADPEFARTFAETAYLNREAMRLNDMVPTAAAQTLPQLLANDWNVRVECGSGQFIGTGPSWVQCLIGTRRVARAIYSGALKPPEAAVAAITTINATTYKKFGLNTTETEVRIDFPYKQPPARVADYVNAAYASREVNARRKLLAQFSITLENYIQGATQTLDLDPALSLAEQWAGVNVLLAIKQREPNLLKHADVVVRVTKRAAAIDEAHLGLRVSVAAAATYEETLAHLKDALGEPALRAARAKLDDLNARVAALGAKLKRRWDVGSRCEGEGTLTLGQCVRSLERLESFAARYPRVRVEAQEIVIVGHGAPGGHFELARTNEAKPKVLFLIRHGFKFSQLDGYVRTRGWYLDKT